MVVRGRAVYGTASRALVPRFDRDRVGPPDDRYRIRHRFRNEVGGFPRDNRRTLRRMGGVSLLPGQRFVLGIVRPSPGVQRQWCQVQSTVRRSSAAWTARMRGSKPLEKAIRLGDRNHDIGRRTRKTRSARTIHAGDSVAADRRQRVSRVTSRVTKPVSHSSTTAGTLTSDDRKRSKDTVRIRSSVVRGRPSTPAFRVTSIARRLVAAF